MNFKKWLELNKWRQERSKQYAAIGNAVTRKAPIKDCLFFINQNVVLWPEGRFPLHKDHFISLYTKYPGERFWLNYLPGYGEIKPAFYRQKSCMFGVHKTVLLTNDWLLEPILSNDSYTCSLEQIKSILPFLVKPFIERPYDK